MSSEVKKIKPPSLACLQAARALPRQTDTHIWEQHFGQGELPLPPGSDPTELWVRSMSTRQRAQGCWGAAASSSCPTAPSSPHASAWADLLPQHPHPEHCSPTKSLSKTQPRSLFCKRILLHDALPLYAFYSPSMTLRHAELLVQTLLFSPHRLPFCRTTALSSSVRWLFQPKFHALHLPVTLLFVSSKPFLQFVELISILALLSNRFAVAPSLVLSVNLSSIVTTYSTIQAANKNGEQNLLPPSSLYSLPLPVKLRAYRGCFPAELCVTLTSAGSHISQRGQRVSKAAMLILHPLLSALQTLPEVCFIALQLRPAVHYTTKERRKE